MTSLFYFAWDHLNNLMASGKLGVSLSVPQFNRDLPMRLFSGDVRRGFLVGLFMRSGNLLSF